MEGLEICSLAQVASLPLGAILLCSFSRALRRHATLAALAGSLIALGVTASSNPLWRLSLQENNASLFIGGVDEADHHSIKASLVSFSDWPDRNPELRSPGNETVGLLQGYDKWTAVYDISAHTVYLPNGAKLEAHSGLGPKLDNPRFVHERMRGPTPPNVYELSFREKPFHGVRALRLKPKDTGKVFGRSGLLAHTYMLGPNGDSNGCVVFKDYDAFLRAFESGEVKRLAVVATVEAIH